MTPAEARPPTSKDLVNAAVKTWRRNPVAFCTLVLGLLFIVTAYAGSFTHKAILASDVAGIALGVAILAIGLNLLAADRFRELRKRMDALDGATRVADLLEPKGA